MDEELLAALEGMLTVPEEQAELDRQRAMVEALMASQRQQRYRSPMAAGIGAVGNVLGGVLGHAKNKGLDAKQDALIQALRAGRGGMMRDVNAQATPFDPNTLPEIDEAALLQMPAPAPARRKQRSHLGIPLPMPQD